MGDFIMKYITTKNLSTTLAKLEGFYCTGLRGIWEQVHQLCINYNKFYEVKVH